MNIYGILSMTVTPKGVVSLWDDMATALKGKEPHDVAFQLSLTAAQIRVVARAETVAKEKHRDAETAKNGHGGNR